MLITSQSARGTGIKFGLVWLLFFPVLYHVAFVALSIVGSFINF